MLMRHCPDGKLKHVEGRARETESRSILRTGTYYYLSNVRVRVRAESDNT